MTVGRFILLLVQVGVGAVLFGLLFRSAHRDRESGEIRDVRAAKAIVTIAVVLAIALLLTPIVFGEASSTVGTVIFFVGALALAVYGFSHRAKE